jgi:hypothetical protein
VEIEREASTAISLEPVFEIEPGADFRDRVADRFLFGGELKVHVG